MTLDFYCFWNGREYKKSLPSSHIFTSKSIIMVSVQSSKHKSMVNSSSILLLKNLVTLMCQNGFVTY